MSNLNEEIINHLAIKIANMEIQIAALTAENKTLRSQMIQDEGKELKVDESSE